MLKLGYNEATCKENSNVRRDLELCEKHGYDYIELRLDMLKEYLKYNTLDDLKDFFAKNKIRPFAFNLIENINFCSPKEWEELINLFTLGYKIAKEIENPYIIVVPTMTDKICTKNEKEVFEDSVEALNKLADIAESYGIRLAFEPIGDRRWCCNSLRHALEIVEAVDRNSNTPFFLRIA